MKKRKQLYTHILKYNKCLSSYTSYCYYHCTLYKYCHHEYKISPDFKQKVLEQYVKEFGKDQLFEDFL